MNNKITKIFSFFVSAVIITAVFVYLQFGLMIALSGIFSIEWVRFLHFICIVVGFGVERASQRLELKHRVVLAVVLATVPALISKFIA